MGKIKLLAIVILAFFLAAGVSHAQETMVRIPYQASYWVQPGDTLLGIGGSSFMEIYEENKSMLGHMDHKGSPNPNRIVEGTRLIIPEGIYVTEKVARAINAQETSRQKALKEICSAEDGRKRLEDIGYVTQEGYLKGMGNLQQARELAEQTPGYGNANYLQAYTLAVQAGRYFDTDIALSRVRSDLTMLQQTIIELKEKIVEAVKDGTFPYWIASAVVLLLVLIIVSWARSRWNSRRKWHLQKRLLHHHARLQALLNGNY